MKDLEKLTELSTLRYLYRAPEDEDKSLTR